MEMKMKDAAVGGEKDKGGEADTRNNIKQLIYRQKINSAQMKIPC